MELLTCKIIALVLLVFIRTVVGLCPLFICKEDNAVRTQQVDLGIALSLALAGGVLLATCFIHLVPEVRDALHYFLPNHRLPITELLIVAGFFLTYFLDEVIVSCRVAHKVVPLKDDESTTSSIDARPSSPKSSGNSHNCLRGFLLSCHSFVKGVAVGLADTAPDVWFLFIATTVHECIAIVGFTLHMMKCQEGRYIIAVSSAAIALVLGAGVVVGILLSSNGVDAVVVAVTRGLAAGNILYVTFYELLTREIRDTGLGLLSHLFALTGFLLMLALQLIGVHKDRYYEDTRNCIPRQEEPDYEAGQEDNTN